MSEVKNEEVLKSLARVKSKYADALAKLAQGVDEPDEIVLEDDSTGEYSINE